MSNKHNHEHARVEEGSLTVKFSGEVKVKLDFVPDELDVVFIDADPSHGCCDVAVPDHVKIVEHGDTFDIKWTIKSKRVIKWVAIKHKH